MAQSLGIAGVLFLFAAGLLAWRIRAGFRRSWALARARMLLGGPARITLVKQQPFRWLKGGRAAARVVALEDLGFEVMAGFSLAENSAVRLLLLRQPAKALLALVREQPAEGTWTEVFHCLADRPEPILAVNVLKPGPCRFLPGEPRFHLPDVPEAELVRAVAAAASPTGRGWLPDLDGAVRFIEEAHALVADRRLLEPLEDYEIRRRLRELEPSPDGCDPTETGLGEEEVTRIRAALPQALGDELRLACRAQFLRDGVVTASAWQATGGCILVVHGRTSLRQLARRRTAVAHKTVELRRLLRKCKDDEAGEPRAAFAALNAALPVSLRYLKLGEVTRPVPADIYAAPARRAST